MKKEQPFVEPQAGVRVATVALMRHGGSHLIRPIVSGMGFELVEPGNFNAPIDKAFGPVVFFPRDPRDRVVSLLRFNLRFKPAKRLIAAKKGTANDTMLAVTLNSEPFIAEMLRWAKIWAVWPGALRLNYEELAASSTALGAVAKISAFLGLSKDADRDQRLLASVFEKSHTFSGEHSHWQDWFGRQSLEIWQRDGGPELVQILGYQE